MIHHLFRRDPTNVGDWWCAPVRYLDLGDGRESDIKTLSLADDETVVLGGGGLISHNFAERMERVAAGRPRMRALIGWGIGESLINDKSGGLVPPFAGALPSYLEAFDLLGIRDWGMGYRWVPCISCLSDLFDRDWPVTHRLAIYEHKRIPLPIDGDHRRTNDGQELAAAIAFLASAETVITNSYHGAYWASLLGRRVIAVPNLSKMHHLRHAPLVCGADVALDRIGEAPCHPTALADCRAATRAFEADVRALLRSVGEA